jgi:hypothetical protein
MDIIIHCANGAVTTHHGRPDHRDLDANLPLGYEPFWEVSLPDWIEGEGLAVRHEDEEYEPGEYDYAEII